VVPITVPSLRERREDIPVLVEHFAHRLGGRGGVPSRRFSPEAVRALQLRPWPGNVRELRNAIERLLILAAGREITAGEIERILPNGTQPAGTGAGDHDDPPVGGTFEAFKLEAERRFLIAKLREYQWNVAETARALDMPRSNLYKKIEKYALNREEG
jgi:two-component system nitrogen regulation response regulator NtrX